MQTDLRPDVRPVTSGPAVQPVRRAPLALALTGLVLALGLALSGAVSVVRDGGEDEAGIRTTAGPERPLERGDGPERPFERGDGPERPLERGDGPEPTATVLGQVFTSTFPPDTVPTTAAPRMAATASTVAPPPATTTPPATTATTAAPTAGGQPAAATAVPACRNSTDPGCGDFRFDPQPGPDSPMTVEVTTVPASPRAGEPMVFHVTLRDPDGVSYGASKYFFGESGIGDSSFGVCKKYGPWDPPAPDPARATVALEVGHTYAEAGSYTATFAFEAGPYECVDSVTGRGDRPYASSAVGSVTVVVG